MNTGPINANNNVRLRIDPRDLFPKNFLRLGFAVDIIGGEDSAAPGVVASGPPAVEAPSGPPAVVAPSGPPAVEAPSGPPAEVAPSGPPAVEAPSGPPAVVSADSGPSVGPVVGNGGAVTGARVVPGSANAVWPSCISSSLTLIISSIAELIFSMDTMITFCCTTISAATTAAAAVTSSFTVVSAATSSAEQLISAAITKTRAAPMFEAV